MKEVEADNTDYQENRNTYVAEYNEKGKVGHDAFDHKTEVATIDKDEIQSELCLGVLWPLQIYGAQVGRFNKQDISEVSHCGKIVKGILRDESHGCPTGCYRLTSTSVKGLIRKVQESSSADDLRTGQTDDVHSAIREEFAAMKTRKRPVKDDDEVDRGILKAPKIRKTVRSDGDSGDEIDFLSVAGPSLLLHASSGKRKTDEGDDATDDQTEGACPGSVSAKKKRRNKVPNSNNVEDDDHAILVKEEPQELEWQTWWLFGFERILPLSSGFGKQAGHFKTSEWNPTNIIIVVSG